jgi:hypothetical protein
VIAWQLSPSCDDEALVLELVRVEQLGNSTMGLDSARRHAVDALANVCPGQQEWVAYDLRSSFSFGTDAVIRHRSRWKFESCCEASSIWSTTSCVID